MIGNFTKDEENVTLAAKSEIRDPTMSIISKMKQVMQIILLRLCRVFVMELTDIYHPNKAARKKRPAVTMYNGPIQLASVLDLALNPDVSAKVYNNPKMTHDKMGKLNQAGTFD